jgi:CubicO group peptidase (beta-lactamase class C family)
MNLFRSFLLIGTLVASWAAVSASDKDVEKQLKSDTDRVVKEAMKSHHVPGMMVEVVVNGKVILNKSYGEDPRFAKSPEDHTMYDLGKVSEALTAFAAMRLLDQGKIGLKDPISKYIQGLPESWQAVTVEQLLTQTSGIPELPMGKETFEEAVAQVGKNPLPFKPGAKRYYRSSNADILGRVVAAASSDKYVNAMATDLFKPLRMDNTGDLQKLIRWHLRLASTADTTSNTNLNRSFGGSGPMIANKVTLTEPELMAQAKKMVPDYSVPSQGLTSTPQDMVKFSSAVLSEGTLKPPTSQFFTTNAPGWEICMAGTETVLRASGLVINNDGVAVHLLPDKKAALILMWQLHPESTNDLMLTPSMEILSGAYDLPKTGWLCTR